ncbi:transcription initiation factor TFIIH subunit 4 [Vigna unguiculata]|uniref:Transcription initiation factor TFIIH subunit 4 n=1 Tax=Vigna unguiculata TaxID=3917 RepID=A0A4D6MH63_VIGUN|nr:transcription initiation factor TFIIH subunit 4 [Vigna unguiculata]
MNILPLFLAIDVLLKPNRVYEILGYCGIRSLLPLVKKYIMQMLQIDVPVAAKLLEEWVLPDRVSKHRVAINRLIKLRVFLEVIDSSNLDSNVIQVLGQCMFGTLLCGLGYGAHWAIVPTTASELFGLKNFGALYNFISLANPIGIPIFSSLIASTKVWDHCCWICQMLLESLKCDGSVCFFQTSSIMATLCKLQQGYA